MVLVSGWPGELLVTSLEYPGAAPCVLALQIAHLTHRHARRHGVALSVRELLDTLASIQETVLIYPSTGGRRQHEGQTVPDGLILTQPWPAGPQDQRRDQRYVDLGERSDQTDQGLCGRALVHHLIRQAGHGMHPVTVAAELRWSQCWRAKNTPALTEAQRYPPTRPSLRRFEAQPHRMMGEGIIAPLRPGAARLVGPVARPWHAAKLIYRRRRTSVIIIVSDACRPGSVW